MRRHEPPYGEMKRASHLEAALAERFPEKEAGPLAGLLRTSLKTGGIAFERIDLPDGLKQDCILAAFEERMLIPAVCGCSSAWEDRILRLCPGEIYFMPAVVRKLLDDAMINGRLDPDRAVRDCFFEKDLAQADDLVRFFCEIRRHAAVRVLEAGLMAAILRGQDTRLDLHAVIDRFVAFGIISPCTRTPMSVGLAWYEINASLCGHDRSGLPRAP